ncbi:MAG: hypothetical protein ACPHCI_03025 [Solirubrobacterales bacterium]
MTGEDHQLCTRSSHRWTLLSGTLFLMFLACCCVGCGDSGDEVVLKKGTIAIAAPSAGPLAERGRDMIDAANLALKHTNYDTGTLELELTADADAAVEPLAGIEALKPLAPSASPVGMLQVSLAAPTAATNSRRTIWLLPSAYAFGEAVGMYGAATPEESIDPVGQRGAFSDDVRAGVLSVVRSSGARTGDAASPDPGLLVSGAMIGDRLVVADNPMIEGVPTQTYVTPALTMDNYPPAGRRFFAAFEEEYDRPPDRFAIFAYEAVGLIVDAIQRLEEEDKPITPRAVRESAFSIDDRFSPVGHYDVLNSGRTTLYLFQVRGADAPPDDAALIEVRR